jgi:cephalosporin-C deacetylase
MAIHGFDVDLANMPSGPEPGKDYWTAGIESPRTSMWRTIFISLVRAVDFMLAQPEADPGRVVVVGGSQGGGLSMAAIRRTREVAALHGCYGFAFSPTLWH